MKIKEMLESGAGRFHKVEDYEKKGIEIINNTPQEIKETVEEMEKRLNGEWKDNEEEKNLQELFLNHFKESNLHRVIRARIVAKFLRDNKSLV